MQKEHQVHLNKARAAYLQEFKNHACVVETEVKKIREELTQRFEEKYGERISHLKSEAEASAVQVQKHKDEIVKLQGKVQGLEAYIAEVKPRLEVEEKLRAQNLQLKEELEAAKQGSAEHEHQLKKRDELVTGMTSQLKALQGQLRQQNTAQQEERRGHEDLVASLRKEMQHQQEQFQAHLATFEESLVEYKAKTEREMEIQEILNQRQAQALARAEDECQKLIKARTKPSARIGETEELNERCVPYEVSCGQYRVDDMGMDTSWREYQLSNTHHLVPLPSRGQAVAQERKQVPKFRVERVRKASQRLEPIAPEPPAEMTPRFPRLREFQASDAIPGPAQPRSAR